MQVNIQGSGIAGRPDVRRHVEQRALLELSRYGDRVGLVRVRLTERAPTAESRYHCGVAVTIADGEEGTGLVLARGQANDAQALVASVFERVGRLAGGEITRADTAREARAQWVALAGAEAGSGR